MPELRDVMAYLCANYPHKGELSKARLTKMIYLADWKSALEHGRQATSISWYFNHYGPYVEDVVQTARKNQEIFDILHTTNLFGSEKDIITVRSGVEYPSITQQDRAVLDHVIRSSSRLTWDEFIELIYSTYPVQTQPRYGKLSLVRLAKEYRESDWEPAAV
jgi:uncharacterized protein YwgA